MSYEIDTIVRRPVSARWLALAFLPFAALACFMKALELAVVAAVAGLPFLLGIRMTRRARVVASEEGLRVGDEVIPRDRFRAALLSHEGGSTWVALRGRAKLDVQVPNNMEADALVRALGLDAASATVEVGLTRALSMQDWILIGLVTLTTLVVLFGAPWVSVKAIAAALGFVLVASTAWLETRVTLRIGADGLVVRRLFRRDWFIPHDAIERVGRDDDAIVLSLGGDARLVLRVGGLPAGRENEERRREREERRADEALAVVRRIQQAQRAFREHAAAANALAGLLDRGRRSAREWLGDLRRIGEGASATFRTMGVARSQLFDVVESTTADAKDRIAATIALRARIADEEKPRIRIAAERCAQPALRERMLRAIDADDETELERIADELRE